MADRYWVGGTASWDAVVGTKWALTSGGVGGQAVPTVSDNVFFNAASGAVTVTISAVAYCVNLNCTGFTGTLTGTSTSYIYGNYTLVTSMTYSVTGTITFGGTTLQTITSAGKSLPAIDIGSASLATSVILADSLILLGTLTIAVGIFDTNSNTINGTQLNSSGTNTRVVYLRNSIINLSSTAPLFFNVVTGLTFNAGTSQINCTSALTMTFAGNPLINLTFYNVAFTGIPATSSIGTAISGPLTFNNLSFVAPSVVGYRLVTFSNNYTINGIFSTTGTAGNRRVWIQTQTADRSYKLTINSAASITDVDFKDIDVVGTAAPISGTRIGDRRNNTGITFNATKNCYRIGSAAASNWSDNQWSALSGSTVSTDYFPLPQDTVIIDQSTGAGTISLDVAIPYFGTLDSFLRTTALSLTGATALVCYGDIKTGSGISYGNNGIITFSGRNTQTITSNGKTFTSITVDSIGGSVELSDAIVSNSGSLVVTNGTFNSKNYNLSFATINSSNTNVRSIILGSSIVTLTFSAGSIAFNTSTNLTFDAGTSTINCTATSHTSNFGTGLTFYNVAFTNVGLTSVTLTGSATFNNLSFPAVTTNGVCAISIVNNLTIGTLVCSGSNAISRHFLQSSVLGTQITLTIGTWSSPSDIDIRDIKVIGAVGTVTGTRLGDCQGNSGITFATPKTVYWNLTGTAYWYQTAFALTSGGTPAVNNFPLAQDTIIFNNAGAATNVNMIYQWNFGTIDMSGRTTAMTFTNSIYAMTMYGNWINGSGITYAASAATVTFSGRGLQTITSAGITFPFRFNFDTITGTVKPLDSVISSAVTITTGTFDANGFNVTAGTITGNGALTRVLYMGVGTWTVTGTGISWNFTAVTNLTFYKGTANIVLSDNSTTARSFAGGSLIYNKLTIGGNTSTSTTTISGSNQFSELASTKTVAHTIAMSGTQTIGTWSVTGTVGNVVTLSTAFILQLFGGRSTGIDYLNATGAITATSSYGEFYMGANSTAATSTGVFLTASPTAVTRYWRGGTGTWDAITTTNWSDTSGGAGGFSVPTSVDTVIFNSASNATAYTVTCTATFLRCGTLNFGAPSSGTLTWAGTAPMAIHNSITLAATGFASTFTGELGFTGTGTGKTINTNGISLASFMIIAGIGATWSLSSSLVNTQYLSVLNGIFNSNNQSISLLQLLSNVSSSRTIDLGTSTVNLTGSIPVQFTNSINLTLNAGTSTINITSSTTIVNGGNQTYYNVNFTSTTGSSNSIYENNTFTNLSITSASTSGLKSVLLYGNQTITGTLTCSGSSPDKRIFIRSDTLGTQRTLTVAAWTTPTNCDVRDILVAGAVAPLATTRFGDCQGNSGITFPASKNCYRKGTGTWADTQWAATSTGTPDVNYFPLAQDTAYLTNDTTTGTHNVGFTYNIGSLVCTNTTTSITLSLDVASTIYGDLTLSSILTFSAGNITTTFSGRQIQNIITAGKSFVGQITIFSIGGTVTLLDAFSSALPGILHASGTFNANGFNVTTGGYNGNATTSRTLNMGSGTWSLSSTSAPWTLSAPTNMTLNASSSTINLTDTGTTARTFAGGGLVYNNLNIGGTTGTSILTISGDNTFNTISSTKTVAHTINFTVGTVTKVANWNVSGTSGNLVTLKSSTVGTKFNLIKTGSGTISSNYLDITDCYATPVSTWTANNSIYTNNSIGWIFIISAINSGFFFMFY